MLTLHLTCTWGSLWRPQIRTPSFLLWAFLQLWPCSALGLATTPKLKSSTAWGLTSQTSQWQIPAGLLSSDLFIEFSKEGIRITSGKFIGKQLKPLAQFLDDVKSLYETEVFSTVFSNVSAAQEINSHVQKQTKGKVVGLIEDLKPNTIMVLVNYIHFKGKSLRYAFVGQCSNNLVGTLESSWSLPTSISRCASYHSDLLHWIWLCVVLDLPGGTHSSVDELRKFLGKG